MPPRVSIILTTYNRASLLRQALDSVAAQTFTDTECIVIDDGSTDDTHALLADWPRPLRVIYHDHTGRPEPLRNAGLRAARGDLIAFLDDDDRWRPAYLARQVAQLDANPAVGLAYCDVQFLAADGRLSTPRLEPRHRDAGRMLDHLLGGWAIYPTITFFRRSLLEKTGLIDETLFTQGDYDFLLRLAYHAPAACTPEPLAISRRDATGLAARRDRRHYENALLVLARFTAAHRLSVAQRRIARRTRSRWHNHLAQLDLEDGQPSAARRHFRQSLSLYPLQRRAWLGLRQTSNRARS